MKKLKRFYINVIHLVFKAWWFITRPEDRGVKVLLKYKDEILLVQHNYGHRLWTFPGGGVKNSETYEEGGRREMEEELHVLVSDLKNIGSYFTNYEYKKVTVECFVAEVESKVVSPDDFEIIDAAWFTPSSFPRNRAPSVNRIMELYDSKQQQGSSLWRH